MLDEAKEIFGVEDLNEFYEDEGNNALDYLLVHILLILYDVVYIGGIIVLLLFGIGIPIPIVLNHPTGAMPGSTSNHI